MQTIHQAVALTFRYPVHFTTGLFALDNPLLAGVVAEGSTELPKKVLAVLDSGVAAHHPGLAQAVEAYCSRHADVLELVCPPLVVAGGEGVKNDPVNVERVHRAVHEHGIDRHAYIVAIGGGAVLDMVGYAAATAHRGVRLVRVPTTVLSQNDSAVGVKNGVNAFGKKNFLGTFAPPVAVLNDFGFLTTLHDRDWLGGISEAVKVALLKDPAFFAFIENHADALVGRDLASMKWLVYRCAELHLQHIATSGDPFEFGSSRPLDFGHWAAHKLEALSAYRLRHGEAVAIGLALDATYSHMNGLLPEADWRRIIILIASLGLPLYAPELGEHLGKDHPRSVLSGLSEFREHLGGRLTIMLLEGIGRGQEVHEMDEARLMDSIAFLKDYAKGGASWPAKPALAR
ncbi:MAG: 3-dehydroquinate synthase [Deinococcota bacterium]|nr:3-dehydroquinate synthase [Deinococcota bacterium]